MTTRLFVERRSPTRHPQGTGEAVLADRRRPGTACPHVDQALVRPLTGTPDTLLDAALHQPAHGLPHAAALEARFGEPLGWVRVRSGPVVAAALDQLGAQAATRGADVFLRDRSAPVGVVAHEVTHALQARSGAPSRPEPAGEGAVVGADAPQEVEADRLAEGGAGVAGQRLAAPVRPAEGLSEGAIALLRRVPAPDQEPTLTVAPEARAIPSLAATPSPTPAADPTPADAGPAPAARTATPASATAGTSAPAGPEEAGEAFAVPPMPELDVSAEQVAAHEAAAAEAQAGLAAAGSASEVLHAFADAPPSVKAQQSTGLSARIGEVLPAETEQWQAAVPTIDADLAGEAGPAPAPVLVEAPAATETDLEPVAPAPAPEAVLPEVVAPTPFTANDAVSGGFARLTEPAPEQLADAIGDSLGDVRTSDPSVPRTPGPPPPIPLGGETDPARIADQQAAGREQAGEAQRAATRLVVEGPGPEQVQPVAVHESHTLEAVAPPATPTLEVPAGPDSYLALGLPPEVQVAFDEQQHQAMAESLAGATAQADEAVVARDTARDEAVATAEEGAAALNDTARVEQNTAVREARGTIQTERQAAIDAQHAEVARVEGEAEDRRLADEGTIDTQVRAEQQAIDDSYTRGEQDIAEKVAAGERKAEEERAQAEKDAEEESWWDRAVSFVKDAFDALVSAIGDIFDAVRAAVNATLDALKAFALSVIDRVASFVKDAIAAYGEFLKFAVDGLIGDIFPELAAELTAAIDTAVTAAQEAVDVVADTLKAGVSALVEGLRAGINAALDVYEAAISFAVSVVGAALTGDWGAVARMVLEAVLKLVGVDPEAFYAFVGRAQETFDIIVNDPLGFLSHLVDALVGGVQGFADRFGEHLQKGIIDWLTGTLGGAGITLPATFDLLGVLDIARQVLGLTWERMRAKAVRLVGEQNVARLEYIGGYVTTLVTEGWSGLWNKLMADLTGLLDTVFDGIKSFLMERVVLAMIKKIPALFGPVGAIVQLVMTAWNLYEFLRDQLARIAALVTTVVDSIGDIARGILTAAVAKVEEVLGSLVPIALDLLAKLLGLGNLSADVRKVIDKVQESIDRAIDALITRVLALFTGRGSAATPATSATAPADAQDAAGAAPSDTFTLAGEDHTIRAVGPAGAASVQLASGEFGDLVTQLTHVVAGLKRDHATPGGAKYVGDAQAPKIVNQLDGLLNTAQTIVADVVKETDKTKETALIKAGIANLKRRTTILNKALGLDNPAEYAPGTGAPGIGEAISHGAQPPRVRQGPPLLHTESEHIIPYKIGDALLAVVDLSTGSRRKSPKFDKAMLTLVIYRAAAAEKTDEDLKSIKSFNAGLASARVRDRLVGAVMREHGGTGHLEGDGRVAFGQLVGALEEVRRDATHRTQVAVLNDHRARQEGSSLTNGLRRGEMSPIPDNAKIESTAQKQYDQLFDLARAFVEQRGDQPVRPEAPSRNVITTVSLEKLNSWSQEELSQVQGLGPARAGSIVAYIRTNGPFPTWDAVLAVPGIGPATVASIRG